MTALIGFNVLLALGYIPVFLLVLRHLKDRDALERDERTREARERAMTEARHAAQLEHLVSQIREAQASRADEIQSLLQRIQAPEVAVIQHQQESAGPDNVYPLTEEESAEAHQALNAALAEIERTEREGVMHG